MRKEYIKPRIIVIPQTYVEGVMLETLSLGTGTVGATTPPDAKPGDPLYDENWDDPNAW